MKLKFTKDTKVVKRPLGKVVNSSTKKRATISGSTYGGDSEVIPPVVPTVAPSNVTPPTTSPSILTLGNEATAEEGTWEDDEGATTTYQWGTEDGDISGAINSTFTLISAVVGKLLRCTVTKTNSAGSTSVSTVPLIVGAPPINTVTPTLSPIPATVGEVVSCSTGTWTGIGTLVYAYRWLLDGVEISGEVGNSLTILAGMLGDSLTCEVSASSEHGAALLSATATATIVIAAPVA